MARRYSSRRLTGEIRNRSERFVQVVQTEEGRLGELWATLCRRAFSLLFSHSLFTGIRFHFSSFLSFRLASSFPPRSSRYPGQILRVRVQHGRAIKLGATFRWRDTIFSRRYICLRIYLSPEIYPVACGDVIKSGAFFCRARLATWMTGFLSEGIVFFLQFHLGYTIENIINQERRNP